MSFRPQKLSVDGRQIRTPSHVRRASSGGVPSAALSNINEGNENETPIGRKISRLNGTQIKFTDSSFPHPPIQINLSGNNRTDSPQTPLRMNRLAMAPGESMTRYTSNRNSSIGNFDQLKKRHSRAHGFGGKRRRSSRSSRKSIVINGIRMSAGTGFGHGGTGDSPQSHHRR